MVDYQRQLLDGLMGRNRDLDAAELEKIKEKSWKDAENCTFYLVSRLATNFISVVTNLLFCSTHSVHMSCL